MMTDETKPTHGALGGPKAKAGKNRRLPAVRGVGMERRQGTRRAIGSRRRTQRRGDRSASSRLGSYDRHLEAGAGVSRRVEEHLARYRERFLQEGLADKARRIAEITKLYYLLEVEIEFRGRRLPASRSEARFDRAG